MLMSVISETVDLQT